MATWNDVRTAATRLPDFAALGAAAPRGHVLALRTVDLLDMAEILAAMPDVFFTAPHFDGYPKVLARLEVLELSVLDQLLRDAWRHRAPKRLVREHDEH